MNKLEMTARADVDRILKRLAVQAPGWQGSWDIELLGQGEQAHLFLAGRGEAFCEQTVADKVVIKVYRHKTAEDRQAFANETQCLEILHAAFQHKHTGPWSLHAPTLHYTCEDPLAMVMSVVPGVPIDRWLQSHRLTQTNCSAMEQAIVSALQCLWSEKMMYGDLNLKNILCEPSQKTLGFIDPGLPNSVFCCDQVPRQWYPASRDLAYLLYSVAVSVKSTLNNPPARKRQLSFVRNLLQHFLESTVATHQRPQLLEEIRRCAQVHVDGIKCSWSPSGIWRRLVKQLTQRSLDSLLTQLAVPTHGGRM